MTSASDIPSELCPDVVEMYVVLCGWTEAALSHAVLLRTPVIPESHQRKRSRRDGSGTGDNAAPRPPSNSFPTEDRRSPTSTERPWSLDDLPVAVLILHDDDVVAVNEQWTALTGLDLSASRGDGWLSAARRGDRAAMRAFLGTGARRRRRGGRLAPDGSGRSGVLWVQARAHHVENTEPDACVLTFAEIEAHATTDSKLLHLATHDALTGLLNRAAFIAEVEDALQRAAPPSR